MPSISKPAWLLSLGNGRYAAVGQLHLTHLLTNPECFNVPHSPFYCQQVCVWQGNILPVMNLASRLAGQPLLQQGECKTLLGIVAFQATQNQPPQYGGVLLDDMPARIDVTDEQATELPEHPPGWQTLSSACFEHPDHGPVPILNLPAIFSIPTSRENLLT